MNHAVARTALTYKEKRSDIICYLYLLFIYAYPDVQGNLNQLSKN